MRRQPRMIRWKSSPDTGATNDDTGGFDRRNVLGALAHCIALSRIQWAAAGPVPDARHIDNGHQIYSVTYADQPYIVVIG